MAVRLLKKEALSGCDQEALTFFTFTFIRHFIGS